MIPIFEIRHTTAQNTPRSEAFFTWTELQRRVVKLRRRGAKIHTVAFSALFDSGVDHGARIPVTPMIERP